MDLTEYFEFISAPRIVYGPGSLNRIGKVAVRLGRKKPFLVMDRIFVDKGLDRKISELLSAEGMEPVGLLTDIPQDSEIKIVKSGYDTAFAGGADLIIALGGGSTIDTAKGLRVMLAEGGILPEGINVIKQALPPMIAIPTTAGTGSEATSAAVIRDKERGLKIGYTDSALMPDIALLDPELTFSLPPAFTAGTGMDALTHAIESLHSTNSQPLSDGMALHAIRLISKCLPVAMKNPEDVSARGQMLLAATLAGLAFSNSLVGIVHAAAHACGAAFRVPHGTACGALLAYGMEFNLGTEAEAAYAQTAAAMGVNTAGMEPQKAAMAAVRAVRDLTVEIGIPQSLKDAGVPEDGLDTLVDKALMDGTMITNPRQPNETQLKAFFKKAWLGAEPCDKAMESAAPKPEAAKKDPQAAPKKKDAKKKEEKEEIQITVDDMYKTAGRFAKKLFTNPAISESLRKSSLIIRFVYTNEAWGDEEVTVTIDCSADPIAIHMGESPVEPVVTMKMSSETARLFWLQKLNLMGAISKGEIQIQGAVNEAMRLLPAIKPGFTMFKDIDPSGQSK